jgi:hypothetical protein
MLTYFILLGLKSLHCTKLKQNIASFLENSLLKKYEYLSHDVVVTMIYSFRFRFVVSSCFITKHNKKQSFTLLSCAVHLKQMDVSTTFSKQNFEECIRNQYAFSHCYYNF